MKSLTFIRLSILSLCIFSLWGQIAHAAGKIHSQPLDRIIAIVNDSVITESELNYAMQTVETQMTSTHTPQPPTAVLRKQVLDQLINRKIQLQLAEQAGIQVSNTDVTKTIANIAHQNKMTTHELLEQAASQGLTNTEYRKEIYEELTVQQIEQQEVGAHITITPQEVDDFIRSKSWQSFNSKEYHIQDILITLPEVPTPRDITEAKEHAEALLNKLHHGLSFQEAAIAESGGEQALQGGDLGWRKLPEIPGEFSSQLVNMRSNDIAGPILTPNGFHIIKLAGTRNVNTPSKKSEIQHNQIKQLIFQRKFEEALQSWINKIHSEAFVNLHPEN